MQATEALCHLSVTDIKKTFCNVWFFCKNEACANCTGWNATTVIWLLWADGASELICIVSQISLQCPTFIAQSFLLQISILRCIISCSKKNGEDLIKFQKILVAFMTPMPFAYTGTMSIFRLSNQKSLGYAHLVSKYLSWCLSQSYVPQAGASSGF